MHIEIGKYAQRKTDDLLHAPIQGIYYDVKMSQVSPRTQGGKFAAKKFSSPVV